MILDDITLGEIIKAMVNTNRSNQEIADAIKEGRQKVYLLRGRYQKEFNKEIGLQYARGLRDLGHFEQSMKVAASMCKQYPEDLSVQKLLENIRKYVASIDDESA
jgi:hypothetical protein